VLIDTCVPGFVVLKVDIMWE